MSMDSTRIVTLITEVHVHPRRIQSTCTSPGDASSGHLDVILFVARCANYLSSDIYFLLRLVFYQPNQYRSVSNVFVYRFVPFGQSFGLMSLKTGQHSSLELDKKAKVQFDMSVNIQRDVDLNLVCCV